MSGLILILLVFQASAPSLAFHFTRTDEGGLRFDEGPYECNHMAFQSTIVCDGKPDCYYSDNLDEGATLCAPEAYLRQDLWMRADRITSTSAFLTWSSGPEVPSPDAEDLKLSGYFLTGRSSDHTFQKIIEPNFMEYNASCLKPWTEYNITLRRFYPRGRYGNRQMSIGRAAAVVVRTNAYAPPAPSEIQVISAGEGEVDLRIVDPLRWNGLPLKYHIRWEPRIPQSGPPGNIELDIPATRPYKENWMNVTLSLHPGARYTVFVSAENEGERENVTFRGPEISRDVTSIPMGPAGLNAFSLSSHELLVSWRVSGPAEYFRVNVSHYTENPDFAVFMDTPDDMNCNPFYDSMPCHRKDMMTPPPRLLEFSTSVLVDGDGSQSSGRHVIVDGLPPSQKCTVVVEACGPSGCSTALSTEVTTKPVALLVPTITAVASNNSSSFKVEWTFNDDDTGYYDGFLVRYCSFVSSCQESYTHLNNFEAVDLSADTMFDIYVHARVKHNDGRIELGPSAKAQVSTWKEVPLEPILEIRASEAMSNGIVISWTFINSTIDYLQVSKQENNWMNCTDDVGCDVTVMYGWTPQLRRGFIVLQNLVPYTHYSVSLRGCNDAGCGGKTTVNVTTGMEAPGQPIGLSVLSEANRVHLAWDRPSLPAGPLSGYFVSWLCPSSKKMSDTVERLELDVEDLPEEGSNCTFWVSAFNKTPNGHLLVGKAAEESLP